MAEDQNVHSIVRGLLGLTASQQPMETNALIRELARRIGLSTAYFDDTTGALTNINVGELDGMDWSSFSWVNVTAYGAIGDGTTDDAPAIQAAIDAAAIGSIIVFPAGTYRIDTRLSVSKVLRLTGFGWNNSVDRGAILKAGAAMTQMILASTGGIQVAGLIFYLNSLATDGVSFNAGGSADSGLVEDCFFYGGVASSTGAYVRAVNNYKRGWVRRNAFSNGSFHVQMQTQCDEWLIADNQFINSSVWAVQLLTSGGHNIGPNNFDTTAAGGFIQLSGSEHAVHDNTMFNIGDGSPFVDLVGTDLTLITGNLFNQENNVLPVVAKAISITSTAEDNIIRNNLYSTLTEQGYTGGDVLITTPVLDASTARQNIIDEVIGGNLLTAVASVAGTMTLQDAGQVFNITGTEAITSITASWAGRIVRLVFASTATLTDGSNLKLAGNFSGSADDVVTLVCDGTSWIEVSRSAN